LREGISAEKTPSKKGAFWHGSRCQKTPSKKGVILVRKFLTSLSLAFVLAVSARAVRADAAEEYVSREVSITIKTDDVRGALKTAQSLDGAGVGLSFSAASGEDYAELTKRVPFDRLNAARTVLRGAGEVEAERESRESFADEYADLEARESAARGELLRLNALMAGSADVQIMVFLNQRISEVSAVIDSCEGRMRQIRSETSSAKVNVVLTKNSAAYFSPPRGAAWAFRGSLRFTAAVFKGLGLFIAAAFVPLLAVGAAALLILRLCGVKIKKKRGGKTTTSALLLPLALAALAALPACASKSTTVPGKTSFVENGSRGLEKLSDSKSDSFGGAAPQAAASEEYDSSYEYDSADLAPSAPPPSDPALSAPEPMLIRDASIELYAEGVDAAAKTAGAIAEKHGGYTESSSSNVYDAPGGEEKRRVYSATFRVPSENYEKAKTELSELSELVSITESAREVSAEYFDSQSRLETLRIERTRILELIDKAADTYQVVELERRLGQCNTQIALYESKIKRLEGLAAYSVIRLDISNVKAAAPKPAKDGFWAKLARVFTASARGVAMFFAAAAVPVVVFGGIIWGIVRVSIKAAKKNRLNRENKDEEKPASE
jgi:hypothetical protein